MSIRFVKSILLTLCFLAIFPAQVLSKDVSVESLQFIESFTKNAKKARNYYAGKTLHYYERGHGTQIEYTAGNGISYLWYPKNKLVVPGRWKIQMREGHARICYKYPTNSYNPLTMTSGGSWECRYAVNSLLNNVERIKGDPFKLQAGLPFKLSNRKTSFKKLARKAKLNSTSFTYFAVPPK